MPDKQGEGEDRYCYSGVDVLVTLRGISDDLFLRNWTRSRFLVMQA